MSELNAREPRMRRAEKPIRCPYCVDGGEFKVMNGAEGDARHACEVCGHLAVPSNPLFECNCERCVQLKIF